MVMEIERAIEILNPEHREHYNSIDTVNEAFRMGMEALEYRVPRKLSGKHGRCPNCKVVHCLHNQDGVKMRFCGFCGQAIDWEV